ncbi:MAG TPA: TolC family protein [Vicinamibacterales bacterium]|jgi:outer membrane protein TolC|nr:TolC family protein [Vicinamibacterales bacterium]
MTTRLCIAVALLALVPTAAVAQSGDAPPASSPFFGSVPAGLPSADPLPLTLKDAVSRGLEHNLGLLAQEASADASRGARWRALSELLPDVSGSVGERRQVINLEAFGFPAPDPIVGPFNVFDARVSLSQSIVDLAAFNSHRAAAFNARAESLGIRTARELVVLVAVNLYLEAVTASSRIEVARAQLDTAEALLTQARNLKASGLVAGIDVVRASVQVQSQRQRRIVAGNEFEKAKLRLARAIGVPPGQSLTLVDAVPYAPLEAVTLEQALADAYAKRADYLAARDRLSAAAAAARAASAEQLPTLTLDADYGTIGQKVSAAHPTYAIAATVRVPIFEGGRAQGRRIEANAQLRQRRAEFDDFRGRIDLEVRSAFLDVQAAAQQIEAARTAVVLADQELTQARDRFAAGVASNIEVTSAQQSVAAASESYIVALYSHNVAKASLARAVGVAEETVAAFLTGAQ